MELQELENLSDIHLTPLFPLCKITEEQIQHHVNEWAYRIRQTTDLTQVEEVNMLALLCGFIAHRVKKINLSVINKMLGGFKMEDFNLFELYRKNSSQIYKDLIIDLRCFQFVRHPAVVLPDYHSHSRGEGESHFFIHRLRDIEKEFHTFGKSTSGRASCQIFLHPNVKYHIFTKTASRKRVGFTMLPGKIKPPQILPRRETPDIPIFIAANRVRVRSSFGSPHELVVFSDFKYC
jgi:hypothetical protein